MSVFGTKRTRDLRLASALWRWATRPTRFHFAWTIVGRVLPLPWPCPHATCFGQQVIAAMVTTSRVHLILVLRKLW